MPSEEVYCGAPVDGGLCLLRVVEIIANQLSHSSTDWTEYVNSRAHEPIPAYVRCPECDGLGFYEFFNNHNGERDEEPCPRCATSPTPGFIPVSEEVRT